MRAGWTFDGILTETDAWCLTECVYKIHIVRVCQYNNSLYIFGTYARIKKYPVNFLGRNLVSSTFRLKTIFSVSMSIV